MAKLSKERAIQGTSNHDSDDSNKCKSLYFYTAVGCTAGAVDSAMASAFSCCPTARSSSCLSITRAGTGTFLSILAMTRWESLLVYT